MTELQRVSRLDRHQCAMLLAAFERLLADKAVDMTDVELDGFGRFESHKHPEYIQENQTTGEVVLYPPRISYRFRSEIDLH